MLPNTTFLNQSLDSSFPSLSPSTINDGTDEGIHYAIYVTPAASIVSKITAGLSIIGSYVILREMCQDRKTPGSRSIQVIHNLLIGLSVADLLSSIPIFLGTLLTDQTTMDDQERIWGSKGNTATCELQGFLHYLGYLASPLFNCALAATYMLLVRYHKRGDQLRPYQPIVHGVIWLLSLALAVIPLALDWYNNAGDTCWVESSPSHCIDDNGASNDESVSCDRGGVEAFYYTAILEVSVPMFSFVFCGVCMFVIWRSVRNSEDLSASYSSGWRRPSCGDNCHSQQGDNSESNGSIAATDRTKSREMMKQGLFFIAAFFVTYVPPLLIWFVSHAHGVIWFIGYIVCLPLQGFWNCLVFVRQREMRTAEGKMLKCIAFCLCHQRSMEQAQIRRGSKAASTTEGSTERPSRIQLIIPSPQEVINVKESNAPNSDPEAALSSSLHSFAS